ncbi:HAD-IA family hydrolase [Rathayibacter soli]|uniref:HAD-IA family hydrolase n=1 Tax=Rathayibacter soli TaxID=3144168 RepID=UPI0027E455CC|nr:HAD-IA family hydrolase [Glaciibacter superstes]
MNLYFFDCDDTLYDYDFRKRLPALARLTGASEYHLASTWWAGGHERAAEAGVYTTSEEYLKAFRLVTGAKLSLDQWRRSRASAMTAIPGSIAALRWAAGHGTTSLLSNNPIPFYDCLPELAPEAHALFQGNDLISAILGARKPERRIYTRALGRFGVRADDAILIDDSAANVQGAIDTGMHGYQLRRTDHGYDTAGLQAALEAFAAR